MAQAIGAKARIIYQEETTFKTDPSVKDAKLLYFISEDFKSTRNLIDSEVIRGTRDAAKPALGNMAIEGTIRTELQAYIGSLFKGLLGNVTTTGTDPYVHVLKVGGSLPSFVIEKGFTDIGQFFKYNGCKINRFTLAVKAEGFQEISFDFLGAKETVSSSSFDSTPADLGKVSWTGFDIAVIEEGGSAIGVVTEVNITVENNLDGSVYVIGGRGERYSLPEGLVKVSGTIKALFDSMSLLNKAMNSTETSLRILYKLGNGDGSAGNESLEILIPELLYSPNAPVISGPAGIFVELPFTAYYDNSTEGTSIQLTLKNTQATL
jgi:hypothetical protein